MPPVIKGTYSSDWSRVARLVKDEAMWSCVRCGHVHDPAAGRCLTVHHFDGDKGNNARWNLMALCQACHLSVQARVNPEVGLLFDPRPWAMPYIAGFYEAGRGVLGVGYDLGRWMGLYNEAAFGAFGSGERRTWPEWAPMVQRRMA